MSRDGSFFVSPFAFLLYSPIMTLRCVRYRHGQFVPVRFAYRAGGDSGDVLSGLLYWSDEDQYPSAGSQGETRGGVRSAMAVPA